MDPELKAMEGRLNVRFDNVDTKIDDLSVRVGVLHEEAMSEFRFSLEAVEGTKQVILRKLDERADSIEKTLEIVKLAVRANHPERV